MEDELGEPNRDMAGFPAGVELDAHGHDPSEYDWVPVLRRQRSDGWTPQRQVEFIAALSDCGCVRQAAANVGISVMSCYRLRRTPGAENFAAAWDAALAQAARLLVDLAFERAINGSDEPVFDKEGHRVGRRMRPNDKLMMFLMRAYMPERFRHAHKSVRYPDEESPLQIAPVGDAIKRLEPVTPENPHLLMAPDELASALEGANALNGELPHFLRADPCGQAPELASFGNEFESRLEAAKMEAADLPSNISDHPLEDEFLA